MKKQIILLFSFIIIALMIKAQAPQAIPYQAVARNASGVLITNQNVSLRFSIHDATTNGTVVYSETQNAITNAYGLFSVNIGQGTPVSGSFTSIDWGSAAKFTQVEIDLAGGSAYVDMGTQQMMSVPYAQYANNGLKPGNAQGNMQYWNGTEWVLVAAGTQGQLLTFCNGVPTWGGCPPTLTTTAISGITAIAASSGGNISNDGSSPVTARGVCWSTSTAPTIALSTKTSNGTGTGSFTSAISGLSASTIYYVRAYATNSAGTSYGNEFSFTTLDGIPTLPTPVISGLTATNVIITSGVTSDGGAPISERGVCYGSSPNVTIANNRQPISSGLGVSAFGMGGLPPGTTYYLKGYCINATGTYYSDEVTYTTLSGIATLTTNAISSITGVSGFGGGQITATNGANTLETGLCYSTSPGPTYFSSKVSNFSPASTFTNTISGLIPATTYYVRAFSRNNALLIAYGNEVSFTTANGLITMGSTSASSCVTGKTAISGGAVTGDGQAPITARGVCWSTSPNPTTANSKTTDGSGLGTFTSNLSNLTPSTTYHLRCYATNAGGTSYGNEITFTTTARYVGESFAGGVIIYVDCSGVHGITAATSNCPTFLVAGTYWYNYIYTVLGGTNTAIGTGQANSDFLYAAEGGGPTILDAAVVTHDFVLNGFSDWYLPSKDELALMIPLKDVIGGFTNESYWSSSEHSQFGAWSLNFFNSTIEYRDKHNTARVRAVRSF